MRTQVLVVGAGPVGLALAAELRLGGASVIVLERRNTPSTESRASTLHARTMELFDHRGLVELLGSPPNDRMGHFGGIPLDLVAEPTAYPGQWKVPQTQVEAMLGRRARRLGADVRHGCEVTGLDDVGDRVRVTFDDGDGETVIVAEYVVGCDGEESTVRALAGFESAGHGATRQMLRADVAEITIANRRFERFPGGLVIAARRGDGLTRVMVHEHEQRMFGGRCDFASVADAWRRVVGEDISMGRPVWVNAFGNTSRQVTAYRRDRVLLAGDAAHQQMPVGGQALNLGLQDAFNLGWKLAAQVSGAAPPGLLDSYHRERHEVGRQVLDNIEAQTLLLLGGEDVEPVRAIVRELLSHRSARAHLANAITGLGIRYRLGADAWAGRRMPHTVLNLGDAYASTTELARSGRGLLLDLSADPSRRALLADIASRWRGRVDLVSQVTPPAEPARLPETVVIRPDGYIAWAGDRRADPQVALRQWFGSYSSAEMTGRVQTAPAR